MYLPMFLPTNLPMFLPILLQFPDLSCPSDLRVYVPNIFAGQFPDLGVSIVMGGVPQ